MTDRFCAHLQQLFHHDDPAQVQAGLELALALPEPELELLYEGCGLVPAGRGGGWLRLRAGRWFHHPEFGPRAGIAVAERVLFALLCRSESAWAATQRERAVRLELGSGFPRIRWCWSELARLPNLRALRIRGETQEDEPFEQETTPSLLPCLELLQLEIAAPRRPLGRLVYRWPRLPRLIEMGVSACSEALGWERVPQLLELELRSWRRTLPLQPTRELRLRIRGPSRRSRAGRAPPLEPLPAMPGLKLLDLSARTMTESIGPWTVQPDLDELHLGGLHRYPGLADQPLQRLLLHDGPGLCDEVLAELPKGLPCLALSRSFDGLSGGWAGTPELVLIDMGELSRLDLSRLHRVRHLTIDRFEASVFIGMHELPWQLRSLTLLRCPRLLLKFLGRAKPPAGSSSPARLEGLHLGMVADLRPLAERGFFQGLRSLSIALGGVLPDIWEKGRSAPATWSDLRVLAALPQLERLHLAWDHMRLPMPDWEGLRALPETTRITMSVPGGSAGETWRADGEALCAALPEWLQARVQPRAPLSAATSDVAHA